MNILSDDACTLSFVSLHSQFDRHHTCSFYFFSKNREIGEQHKGTIVYLEIYKPHKSLLRTKVCARQ